MRQFIFITIVLLSSFSVSQNIPFNQFTVSAELSNPSFNGTGQTSRIRYNFKDQWSKIPGSFTHSLFYADHNFNHYSSGIGITVLNSKYGEALSLTNTQFKYSYRIALTDSMRICLGVGVGFLQRTLNSEKFVFVEDLLQQTSPETSSYTETKFNSSLGIGFYTSQVWIGASISDLSTSKQIDQTLFVQAGYHYEIQKTINETAHVLEITPALLFSNNKNSNKLSTGLNLSIDALLVGVLYTTTSQPYTHNIYNLNNYPTIILGFHEHNLNLTYSYDITQETGGSHEINLYYEIAPSSRKGYRKQINNPFL